MKLSEAIRAGAKLTPQVKGELVFDGATCALGAAYHAVSGNIPIMTMNTEEVVRYLGIDTKKKVWCPVTEHWKTIQDAIIDLNDDYGWSREKIADWLDTLGL